MKQLSARCLLDQEFVISGPDFYNSTVLCDTQDSYMASHTSRSIWSRMIYPDEIQVEGELQDGITGRRTPLEKMDSICTQFSSFSIEEMQDEPETDNDDISIDGPEGILANDAKRVYRQDTDGDTFLHVAIILQNVQDAMACIDIAPSSDYLVIQNKLFQSPLHLSVLTNLPKVARRLVVGGADIKSRDKDGNTPLHVACREGYSDIVDAILEIVRDEEKSLNKYNVQYQDVRQAIEIPNYEGLPCVHLAALKCHFNLVSKLIGKGADVNSFDRKSGHTLLHKAAANGDVDFVKMLLSVPSCDVNARAFDDKTPFDIARDRGYHEITYLLASECTRRAASGETYDH